MNYIPFELPGFRLKWVESLESGLTIHAEAAARGAACPQCHTVSTHVHSHYGRRPQDLPSSGKAIRLVLAVRRFRCRNAACSQKIFCERLPGLVQVSAQRTVRLTISLSDLGLALGGEGGSRQSQRQGMAVSPRTLLRLIRRQPLPPQPTPTVLGVDDFALRRGQVYGTLLVDQQTHRPVDMVPERTGDVLATWLQMHPGVQVITRDRSGEYAQGARQGAPTAVQVADRWHLLHNLWEAAATSYEPYRAVLGQVRLEPAAISAQRTVIAQTVDPVPPAPPKLNPEAQTRQARWEGWQAKFAEVHRLHDQRLSHHAVARQTGVKYSTVRKYLRLSVYPKRTAPKPGPRLLDPYRAYLREQVALGHTVLADLYRDLQARGFTGSRSTLYLGLVLCRHELGLPLQRVPPSVRDRIQSLATPLTPRAFTTLLLLSPDKRSPQQVAAIAQANQRHPAIAQLSAWTTAFATCLRQHDVTGLSSWIAEVSVGAFPALKSFATGLLSDWDAVQAAFTLPFSNGQTEGQVNRLKTIKRSMYGRANFDLLRLRVLAAA